MTAVENFKSLRVAHRLTHFGLAKAAGLTVNTVWRLENDPDAILGAKVSTIRATAGAFGMTPGELLDRLLA